jgi:predicted small metal-binding protein
MTMDCSTMPSESGCTLVITGEEDEVLRAAAAHAVDVHGHTDDENLRNALRASLTEAAAALELQPGAFVQIIEFHTERIDDLISLGRGWTEAIGSDRTARWVSAIMKFPRLEGLAIT